MNKSKIKIIVDAMGGDYAPQNVLLGSTLALEERKDRFEIILAGDELLIKNCILKNNLQTDLFSILHAPETIDMHDSPTAVFKTKKDSSIISSLNRLRENQADAFVSAGNTGAVLSASTLILGRIKNISRPTLGIFLPGEKGPVIVIDGGANVDCKPQFLYEFAIMGSIFAKALFNKSNPSIGLLNIGSEPTKGNSQSLDTYSLLSKSNLNFIGNVEGNDVLKGVADIVICDGFVGNIILKFGESIIPILKSKFKVYASQGFFKKIWIGLLSGTLRKILSDFDYQKFGGVPLLGVNGVVIIGHGKSSPIAIKNMIFRAEEMIEKNINKKIEENFKQ